MRFITSPNRAGVALMLAIWFLIGAAVPDRHRESMDSLDALVLDLLRLNPKHELIRDPDLRAEVLGYFHDAGEAYDLPASLLIYWAYRESSLRPDVVGKLGEQGYCQAHGKARATCSAAGYDPSTRNGGAYCLALLLDMGRRYCGSLNAGAVWYATGSCRGSEKARKKIKQRLREWRRRAE